MKKVKKVNTVVYYWTGSTVPGRGAEFLEVDYEGKRYSTGNVNAHEGHSGRHEFQEVKRKQDLNMKEMVLRSNEYKEIETFSMINSNW